LNCCGIEKMPTTSCPISRSVRQQFQPSSVAPINTMRMLLLVRRRH